ncbi:unnamed protein product [Linum tenue]|uniref:Uncharacterized protein n=1 Tax=Linum tenue TaxID=586396 RepID=A0AAV0GN06_9ROSI|nr:unnamed protein product [Linum tenue]
MKGVAPMKLAFLVALLFLVAGLENCAVVATQEIYSCEKTEECLLFCDHQQCTVCNCDQKKKVCTCSFAEEEHTAAHPILNSTILH